MLAKMWKRALGVETEKQHASSSSSWIVLDGPVDYGWIENLNSVPSDQTNEVARKEVLCNLDLLMAHELLSKGEDEAKKKTSDVQSGYFEVELYRWHNSRARAYPFQMATFPSHSQMSFFGRLRHKTPRRPIAFSLWRRKL